MKNLILVAVVNRGKDLKIATNKHWYRIPLRYAPKRKAGYLALYQTKVFGRKGKSINFYAPIKKYSLVYRRAILPEEKNHPGTNELYQKISLGSIHRLQNRIQNKIGLRVNFGFTTLKKLLNAKEIGQLFNIEPLEKIISNKLKKNGIRNIHQYCIMKNARCRYRLDFALFCKKGKINIECDNIKFHHQPKIWSKDEKRDYWLRKRGWHILRFTDNDILRNHFDCIKKVKHTINCLGGLSRTFQRGIKPR